MSLNSDGANILAGTNPNNLVKCVMRWNSKKKWSNPFGSADAGSKLLKYYKRFYNEN